MLGPRGDIVLPLILPPPLLTPSLRPLIDGLLPRPLPLPLPLPGIALEGSRGAFDWFIALLSGVPYTFGFCAGGLMLVVFRGDDIEGVLRVVGRGALDRGPGLTLRLPNLPGRRWTVGRAVGFGLGAGRVVGRGWTRCCVDCIEFCRVVCRLVCCRVL